MIALTLSEIAIRRLSLWAIQPGETNLLQSKAFTFEIGQLGFKVANPEVFTTLSQESWNAGLNALKEMRGADVEYVPLFSGFPDHLPNDGEYLIRRVLGHWGLDTFNTANFGANPITQMQSSELWEAAAEAQTKRFNDRRVEWITLTLTDEAVVHDRLIQWALALLYGTTPVQETLWDDLFALKSQLQLAVDLDKVRIKETLARLAAREWQMWTKIVVKTPTDLLRMFAFIQEQDVSLADKINLKGLKFSKPQRRAIVQFLARCSGLREDLLRYRGLWISLSKFIHPGDLVKQYPLAAQAFDDLRNNRIQSFESRVDSAGGIEKLTVLAERPAVLLRRLSRLKEVPIEAIVECLNQLAPHSLPLPLLMTVYAALRYEGERLVINKAGKPYCIGARGSEVNEQVLDAVESLICAKLRGTKDWDKVWIDPAIDKLVLPLQARKQSEGLLNLARGSRIAVGEAEAIRLFVYWQQAEQRTDLDLSVLKLDADFKYAGQVSWNSYGDGKDIAHSGDIQSAELGATEFVDLKLSSLDESYILPVILKFAGESFKQVEACYAGWMNRTEVSSDTIGFDPRTVAQKVNVAGDGTTWIPFLFDVVKREIIYVDLYGSGRNTVEGNPHFAGQSKRVAQSAQAKPTYGQLAQWMVKANGAKLVERLEAEVTIGMDDSCTVNVLKLVGESVMNLESPISVSVKAKT